MDNQERIERKKILEAIADNYADAELKDVLETYSGRAVLGTIMRQCKIDDSIQTNDTHQVFRALGKRDVGLWLRNRILTMGNRYDMLIENEFRKRQADLKT